MSHSSVRADASAVSRVDRALFRLESALNLAAGVVIFALVVLAVYNVLGRKFFNAPVPGYVDWTEQFMATFAFLGIAYCQREGGHIRMDVVVGRFRGRLLWAVEFISVLFMAILTVALIYGSWFHFLRSFDTSLPLWSRDSSIDISLPLWPAKLVVPVSLGLLLVRLVVQMWAYGRAFVLGQEAPPAVPLPEDAAAQAMAEAEAVGLRDG